MNDATVDSVSDDVELCALFYRGTDDGLVPEGQGFEEKVAAFELELDYALQKDSDPQKDDVQEQNEDTSVLEQDEGTENDDEQNHDQGLAQLQVELTSFLTEGGSDDAHAQFENTSQKDSALQKYIDMIEQFLISESDSGNGAEARITLNDEFIEGAQVRIVDKKDAVQLEWTAKTTASYRFLKREKEQLGQQLEQRLSKTVAINIIGGF